MRELKKWLYQNRASLASQQWKTTTMALTCGKSYATSTPARVNSAWPTYSSTATLGPGKLYAFARRNSVMCKKSISCDITSWSACGATPIKSAGISMASICRGPIDRARGGDPRGYLPPRQGSLSGDRYVCCINVPKSCKKRRLNRLYSDTYQMDRSVHLMQCS